MLAPRNHDVPEVIGTMTQGEIVVREATPTDDESVAILAFEYLRWAIERLRDEYGVQWPPLTLQDVEKSVGDFRQEGSVLLAELGGSPIGMGAVRRLDREAVEVKRMYVREEARGMRIGATLLDRLMDQAHVMGASVLRLDTIRFMTDAQRLYRSRGFVERPPYEGTEIPESLRKYWLFFERPLAG